MCITYFQLVYIDHQVFMEYNSGYTWSNLVDLEEVHGQDITENSSSDDQIRIQETKPNEKDMLMSSGTELDMRKYFFPVEEFGV